MAEAGGVYREVTEGSEAAVGKGFVVAVGARWRRLGMIVDGVWNGVTEIAMVKACGSVSWPGGSKQ